MAADFIILTNRTGINETCVEAFHILADSLMFSDDQVHVYKIEEEDGFATEVKD